jgi:hypothetical protein
VRSANDGTARRFAGELGSDCAENPHVVPRRCYPRPRTTGRPESRPSLARTWSRSSRRRRSACSRAARPSWRDAADAAGARHARRARPAGAGGRAEPTASHGGSQRRARPEGGRLSPGHAAPSAAASEARRHQTGFPCGKPQASRMGHSPCQGPNGPRGGRDESGRQASECPYGAYYPAAEGSLPAAVGVQAESGQFPVAVLGVVREDTPRGVAGRSTRQVQDAVVVLGHCPLIVR